MILKQLYDDAPAILGEQMPPAMYDVKPVRWVIPITPDGKLAGDTFLSLGGDKDTKRGLPMPVPYVGRTSGVRPILLADKPAYALGVAFQKGVAVANEQMAHTHAAFKALVHQCAVETNDALVAAVDAFLSEWQPDAERALLLTGGKGLDISDLIVFLVGER